MKRNFSVVMFLVISSFMFSSCFSLLSGIGYRYRNPGEGRPIATDPSNPSTGTATNSGSTTTTTMPSTGTTTTTTKPNNDTNTTTNTSATTVVMEAWSNEYHYLFYKNGTVSIMDFNDKELSRPKYTSSSDTITINGEKFRFEDQSDNFESVPHKIGTLVKIGSTKTNNSNKNNDRNPNNRNSGRNRN